MFYYTGGRVGTNERPDGTEGGDQGEYRAHPPAQRLAEFSF
jgi:hypothetical protein